LLRRQIGDKSGLAQTLKGLGVILLGMNRQRAAARRFREAIGMFQAMDVPQAAMETRVYLGEALLAAGAVGRARQCAEEAGAWAREKGVKEILSHSLILLADLLLKHGPRGTPLIVECLREALKTGVPKTMPDHYWRIEGLLGRLCEQQGRDRAAFRHYERAVRRIRSVGRRIADRKLLGKYYLDPRKAALFAAYRRLRRAGDPREA
jgi:tetratricopeptide (TPR) repeat protein